MNRSHQSLRVKIFNALNSRSRDDLIEALSSVPVAEAVLTVIESGCADQIRMLLLKRPSRGAHFGPPSKSPRKRDFSLETSQE
jgi:hypothetical protein